MQNYRIGSPTQFSTITHTASHVKATATDSLRCRSDREDHGGQPSVDASHATPAEPATRVLLHHLPGSRPVAQTDSVTSFGDSSPRGSFDRLQGPFPDGTRAISARPISRYLSFERGTQRRFRLPFLGQFAQPSLTRHFGDAFAFSCSTLWSFPTAFGGYRLASLSWPSPLWILLGK